MNFDPSQIKILLAEDAMAMRKIEIKLLKALGFTEIVEAVDGGEAIQYLEENADINLVISDWNMPNTSGLELLVWIRASENYRDVPFIMATAQSDKKQAYTASEAGVSCFISKPFSPDELQNKIEIALGEKEEEKAAEDAGPQKTVSGKTLLRMAHIQITDHLVLGVLKDWIEKGEVEPKHFELETHCMPSWNPVGDALEKGTIDGALVLAPIAMDLFHYDVPIKLVLLAHKNGSIFVAAERANFATRIRIFSKVEIFLFRTRCRSIICSLICSSTVSV